MTRTTTGWVYVGVQIALLVAIVVVPGGSDWSTPGWLTAVGWVLSVLGVAIAASAALRLGGALTPTPVPSGRGTLTTSGLYRHVRHPIYTGVLLIVLGIVVRSGSLVAAAIGAILVLFFWRKSSWEEAQLRAYYPGYADYAARTPRFVPGLGPRRGSSLES